jgi:hypothetical protein
VANNDDRQFPNWPEARAEWNELRRDLPPPTDDGVGIRLRDSRHLKTRSDLIAHLGEDFILDDNPTQPDDDTRSHERLIIIR